MEHKVLIADDSLTIQKVIKITLANEPFELSECANPDELSRVVRETAPEIVLLDFNLSENKTGYDLCREIKQINPKIGVLMLFGTFDTIDEELLLECGCNYHIVKPFDGSKFINLCRALAQDFQAAPSGQGEEGVDIDDVLAQGGPQQGESAPESSFGEDDWVMNRPEIEEPEEDMDSAPEFEQNDLAKEVEEWGMEVPSVIGAKQSGGAPEIPDVIGGESRPPGPIEISEEKETAPLEMPSEPQEAIEPEAIEPEAIELEELEEDEGIEIETFEPEESIGTETEEELERIKKQIEEEPEEEELWAADVVESDSSSDEEDKAEEFSAMDTDSFDHIEDEDDVALDEVPEDFPEAVGESVSKANDFEAGPIASGAVAASEEISEKIQEELEAQLGAKLSPLVERYVKDYCREQIERVAWEVIPDLAENIIKKEIQKISDSLMDQ